MSTLTESCQACGWRHDLAFHYHGGVPVEHPMCPKCGGALAWDYAFSEYGLSLDDEALRASLVRDEVGFPEDRSPRVARLERVMDHRLAELGWAGQRVWNVRGVVDVELRPFVDLRDAQDGVKLVAHVGSAAYSMALLELTAWINDRLPVGTLSAHTTSYGAPRGAFEIFPSGTHVGLYFQHFMPESSFRAAHAADELKRAQRLAAELALHLRDLLQPHEAASASPSREEPALLDALSMPEPTAQELLARVCDLLAELGLDASPGADRAGEVLWTFSLGSALVGVSLLERGGRWLVRYRAELLDKIDLTEIPGGEELPARILASLNRDLIAGRCLIEQDFPSTQGNLRLRVVLEKTLLATDLDLGEFGVTLLLVAQEADRLDNLLQEFFGGLRADQEAAPRAVPLEALEARLQRDPNALGVPRLGVDAARAQVRRSLEELRFAATEAEDGSFWFTYGSARIGLRVWQDPRATFLTLRARVLRAVERADGLAEALNALNQQIYFGAFALRDDHSVELTETILADELSLQEIAYALVTLGELADRHDNPLQARFGGLLGASSAGVAG